MGDREAYQRILKNIAEKVQNYQNFHHQPQQQKQNQEEKKEKELESKINLICDVTFQKLNVPVLAHEQAKQEKPEEDFGEFEEADGVGQQEAPQEQGRTQGGQPEQSSSGPANAWDMDALMHNNKENNSSLASSANTQMYSMFTFDSEMERAMTKEIGLKKAGEEEKMSIWELQLEESELKTNEPNLRDVFKKNSDKTLPKTPTPPQEQYHQMGSASFNSNDLYHQPALNFTQTTNDFSIFSEGSYAQPENSSFKSHHLYEFGEAKDVPRNNELFSDRDYSRNAEFTPHSQSSNPSFTFEATTPTIAQELKDEIGSPEKDDEEWEEAEQVEIAQ